MAWRKLAFLLIFVIGVFPSPWIARAAGDPAVIVAPPAATHRFLDRTNIALQAFNVAFMGADIASTYRALQVPGTREANPLMKSPASMIAMKAGAVGAGMMVAYMLHRSGHHKAERIFPVLFGIPSGAAAIHNFGIR